MSNASAFAWTDPELLPVLAELERREPIFHRGEFGYHAGDFDRLMAPDYWEIGASGRRYSRSFIMGMLAANPPVDSGGSGWKTSEFGCRRLGPETYLLTYTLDQNGRLTHRSTIWRHTGPDWQILFHQGTVISSPGNDDVIPDV